MRLNLLSESLYMRREYFSSGVNVLTNSLKISDMTKDDILQLNLSRILGERAK